MLAEGARFGTRDGDKCDVMGGIKADNIREATKDSARGEGESKPLVHMLYDCQTVPGNAHDKGDARKTDAVHTC